MKKPATRTKPTDAPTPPVRLRLKLSSAEDVRRELARIYREGKTGARDVSDVSRLANVLQILARCIETGDLERRIEALEASK
ncbi:hypothetical protein [Polaromonas sp. C04]|uniref:hypothetical protein n=1 Tax=Polaromonas sp. C04 TaxID=1945857 RepID=UPI0009852BB1|nr:hypothetical protein [Polaromonas sp. C04]OOG57456.1 hypothetical protein B0E49_05085 [Polaromonas sp. C04]